MTQTLFGYTGSNTANRDRTLYWKFTTADLTHTTVSCTGCGVRFADTGHKIKLGITDGTTWLAQGENTSTIDGLNTVTFPGITLNPSTDYYIGCISDGYFAYYRDSNANTDVYQNDTDPEYRDEDYDDAFDVAVQGAPIIAGSDSPNYYGFSITYTATTPSTSGLLLPPPIAVMRI
jgi:hypothetical protein